MQSTTHITDTSLEVKVDFGRDLNLTEDQATKLEEAVNHAVDETLAQFAN